MKRVLISVMAALMVMTLLGGCGANVPKDAKLPETTNAVPVVESTAAAPKTTQPFVEENTTEAQTAIPEAAEKTTKNEIYTKLIESPSSSKDIAVSKDEAKAIVLNHAALTASDVKRYKAELDRERGLLVYEIEFDSGKYEYEYEVSAESGKILKSEKDFRD